MTFASSLSILLTLGFVLALLGISLKLLRRFTKGANGGRFQMEVVQRLAISPKQGIAVVRIGERMVVVSSGDGGVHRLFELEEEEVKGTAAARTAVARPERSQVESAPVLTPPARTAIDFSAIFASVRGASRIMGVLLAFSAATLAMPSRLQAQGATTAAGRQIQQIADSQGTAGKSPVTAKAAAAKVTAKTAAPATPAASTADAQLSKLTPQMDLRVGGGDGLRMSGTVGVVVMMGLLTLLPSLLLMMTGFTRIFIVLHFVRQALGTQTAPPSQLVAGLALLLTGFVMAPTLSEVNRTALEPWLNGTMSQSDMLSIGSQPFRTFMLKQTRREDIETFVRMSGQMAPATVQDVPIVTLTSAFVISELRTSFQMGFAIFLPFIVIDIAVSAVLMSMGMMMLPPAMISLPFKLLLFVLADGWSLVVQSLVTSFHR